MMFAFRVMPDVHVQIIQTDKTGSTWRFKYMVLDGNLATRWLDQDSFNARFMKVIV
tara:strand:- start:354 stop:521 length:168 start_codon:yes stop_codon:yes gene_type:complete